MVKFSVLCESDTHLSNNLREMKLVKNGSVQKSSAVFLSLLYFQFLQFSTVSAVLLLKCSIGSRFKVRIHGG